MSENILLAVIVSIPPTIASVVAVIVAIVNSRKIEDLHILINSRLTQLLEQTAKASKAEGITIGENK